MVKIFFSSGQLGNQLFQIAAAKRIARSNDTLVFIGYAESFDAIELIAPDCKVFQFLRLRQGIRIRRILSNLVFKSLQWLGNVLLKTDYAGSIKNSPEGPVEQKSWTGISISLHEHFRESLIVAPSEIRLTASQAKTASQRLASWNIHQERNGIARATFLHVRRGDYLEWPHPDSPAALDEEWFTRAITEIKGAQPDQPIIAFSDDPEWVRYRWQETDKFFIYEGSLQDSFALMSTCNSGILSPSTFSWWAAKLVEENKSGPFLAPMFWWGHRQKKWKEKAFKESAFLTFV